MYLGVSLEFVWKQICWGVGLSGSNSSMGFVWNVVHLGASLSVCFEFVSVLELGIDQLIMGFV